MNAHYFRAAAAATAITFTAYLHHVLTTRALLILSIMMIG